MANDVEQPLLEKKRQAYPNCRGCQNLYLQDADAKFPYYVFTVMGALTLVNALPISSLYPFLYFMVKDFKIAENDKDIGFYAGFIGSVFMFGRFLTSVYWGMAADKYGRKPVMICGVISVLIFHTWFGASTTFYVAFISRLLLGCCNGMLGSVKAYASEITSERYQATSISVVGTMWGLGLILGPAMGGYFSQPAIKYPNIFPPGSLFDRYAYLLPSLLVTVVAFPTLFLAFTLPETLHNHDKAEVEKAEDTNEKQSLFLPIPETTSRSGSRKYSVGEGIGSPALLSPFGHLPDSKFEDDHSDRRRCKFSSRSSSTRSQPDSNEDHTGATESIKDFPGANTVNGVQGCQVGSSSDEEESKLTASLSDSNYTKKNKSLWTSRPLMGSITLYCVWSLHDMAYTEVSKLCKVVTTKYYVVLASQIFSLWCVSPIQDGGLGFSTTDVGQVLAISGFIMLLFQLFLFSPVVNFMGVVLLSRYASMVTVLLMFGYPGVTFLHGETLWWVLTGLSILKNVFGTMIFTSSFLLVNNSVRTDQRGAANGLAMSLVSLFKAFGPASGGSLFAWAQRRESNILPGNQLVFFALGVVVFLTVLCTYEPILPRALDHKVADDED